MQTQRIVMWKRAGLAVAIGALIFGNGMARAHERVQEPLTAPGDSTAVGRVRVIIKNDSDGRLILTAHGLAPDQTYDVIVGDVKAGTLRTTGGGNGSLRFRTRPRGHDLMLGFDPHGVLVTIRSADGTDVLMATLPAAGSGSPDQVACCVPGDAGDQCEDRTVDECTARGGTPAAATSCMPNPCAGAPPAQTDIVCCVPDDSGPECEDRTAAECAARGGTVVAATSCTPNPCAAMPPADPDIVCCVPGDGGAECEDRTPDQCAAQGGVNLGAGSCSSNPCAGVGVPATPGGDDHGGHNQGGRHGGADDGGSRGGGSQPYYGTVSAALRAVVASSPTGRAGADNAPGDDRGGRGR